MLCAAASEMWADTRRWSAEGGRKGECEECSRGGRGTGEVGWGGLKEGRQHKEERGHLKFHRCLQLVEVSHARRLQATGRQRGSRPLGMSDCYHHGEMEGEYRTLLNIDQISSRAAAPFNFIASFNCFHVLEQRWCWSVTMATVLQGHSSRALFFFLLSFRCGSSTCKKKRVSFSLQVQCS